MRTALLITGNIRTFELCIPSFEQICQQFDPDIFIVVSNKQYDLHPYIKESTDFYHDQTLSLEQIQLKLNISPLVSSKIKNIVLVDKNEEDETMMNTYLSLFDKRKSWTGLDIFKQFYKFKLGLDTIEAFELQQGYSYNYLIKTRFDLMIDCNTLPIYPVENYSVYTASSSPFSIQDQIFVSAGVMPLKQVVGDVIQCFLSNDGDPSVYTSIHSILNHIFNKNNINSMQNITCSINRNYHLLFNTNITLVTCFYNIGREQWSSYSRSVDKYFENCVKVLKQKYPLFIFTTEEYRERCIEIRKQVDPYLTYTKVVVIPLEQLFLYDKLDLIKQVQINNLGNILGAIHSREPEFTVPEYIIIISNKLKFMKQVATDNLYGSQIFQWIDFGIHANIISETCNDRIFDTIMYKSGKIRIVGFVVPTTISDRMSYYNSHNSTLAAGLFGGDVKTICTLSDLYDEEFNTMIQSGLMNQEQYILYYILCKQTEFFDYFICGGWNELGTSFLTSNNVNIAICMSGHLRSYLLCRENIQQRIISPLKRCGIHSDLFLSSWNDIGFRSDNFHTSVVGSEFQYKSDFTKYEFEEPNQQYFIDHFSTEKWREYSQFSGDKTCPDAVSMLYKISKVYNMAIEYAKQNGIQYDIIIRIRPDMIYQTNIDVGNIRDCLLNKGRIYMPETHGNYSLVTKFMMDHYFFGNNWSMKYVMNTYENIQTLLIENCPHTGEGFLWKQITNNNINLHRFICSYGQIGKNNDYLSIYS